MLGEAHLSVLQGEKPLDMSMDKELSPGGNPPDMSMDEEQGGMRPRKPTSWKQYLHAEVSNKHTDLLMLACCVISGLSDSTIYNGTLPNSFHGG